MTFWGPISNRCVLLKKSSSNDPISIISVYVLQQTATSKVKDIFYDKVPELVDSLPLQLTITLGILMRMLDDSIRFWVLGSFFSFPDKILMVTVC